MIYPLITSYDHSYRACIPLYGRPKKNHGIPGSMAAGPGSSKKWHGILQKKQLGQAAGGQLGGSCYVTMGWHATWVNALGGWTCFFLRGILGLFGCFHVFLALKTLILQ